MRPIQRHISSEILDMAKSYPIVTLTGPRQSGKTTLTRLLFPHKPYISMGNPDERALAELDPRHFLERINNGAIIDEIQRTPFLLSYLQEIVDRRPQEKGLFILTGSHQPSLHEAISQSLSGRTAVLKLLPLSIDELTSFTANFSCDDYLFQGMYPRLYADNIDSTKFYRDYVATYVERDVRQIINVKDLKVFQNFLKLCAGRVGQPINLHNLSNEVGVSHSTITNWLSILEASFVIFRLSPYFENFGKRVIKTQKLYFTDVGLARYLLDIHTKEQLARDPLRGNLFENFIISELLKHQMNKGIEPNFYFFQDSNKNEVDCLYRLGSQFIAIEIKVAQTFTSGFLKGIKSFEETVGNRFKKGFLIYTGQQEQSIGTCNLLNFRHITNVFA